MLSKKFSSKGLTRVPVSGNGLACFGRCRFRAGDSRCLFRAEYSHSRATLLTRLRRCLTETNDPILEGAVISPHHRQALELLSGPAQ